MLRTMRDEAQALQQRQTIAEPPHVDGLECCFESRRGRMPGGDFFDLAAPQPHELTIAVGTLFARGIAGP